ncbi:MAG: DUF3592 domain-containing protein [Planctomycetes bacterium]|nr:DUF3592 domain-containing protein [Planctomycetota bacterium]
MQRLAMRLSEVVSTALNVLLLCVGLVVLGLGVALAAQAAVRLLCWRRTAGTVVGYRRDEGCFLPVIEYLLDDGTVVRFTAGSGRGVRSFKEGTAVPIFYDPGDPQRADLRTLAALWLTPVVLIAMGALFVTLQVLSMLGCLAQ